jgi:hypothetical protein
VEKSSTIIPLPFDDQSANLPGEDAESHRIEHLLLEVAVFIAMCEQIFNVLHRSN